MAGLSPCSEEDLDDFCKDDDDDEGFEKVEGSPWSGWSSPSSLMRCCKRRIIFECPVCSRSTQDELSLSPIELLCCKAQICRDCLVQSVSLNQRRCPLAHGEQVHMLHDRDVFAGCIDTASWFKEEQDKIWKEGGCTGFKCGEDRCIGVIKPHRVETVQPEACPKCKNKYCSRCRVPWLSDEHRCEDLRQRDEEEQREAARQRAAMERQRAAMEQEQAFQERLRMQAIAMVLRARRDRRCSIRGFFGFLLDTVTGQLDHTFNAEVQQVMHQIRARRPRRYFRHMEDDGYIPDMVYRDNVTGRPYALQYRPCPTCDTMVERINGCNMIRCPNCPLEFCFSCGRDERHGCKHFVCAHRNQASDVTQAHDGDEVAEHLEPLRRRR